MSAFVWSFLSVDFERLKTERRRCVERLLEVYVTISRKLKAYVLRHQNAVHDVTFCGIDSGEVCNGQYNVWSSFKLFHT